MFTNTYISCAIEDKTAKCWGHQASGEFGNSVDSDSADSNTPVAVSGLSDVK